MCDHHKHRDVLKVLFHHTEAGPDGEKQWEVENDAGQRTTMNAHQILDSGGVICSEHDHDRGQEALSELRALVTDLETLHDRKGKTGPEDDNYWVIGGIRGDVWNRAKQVTATPGEEHAAIQLIIKALSSWDSREDKIRVFVNNIHKIRSPVDLKEHNPEFRRALEKANLCLFWGTKASHVYKHAYVVPFGDGPGEVYTIISDFNFDDYEEGVFSWENHDLFTR